MMSFMPHPKRLRPSLGRRRWNAPAWGWLYLTILCVTVAWVAAIFTPDVRPGRTFSTFMNVWRLPDGRLTSTLPNTQSNPLDNSYSVRINVHEDAGGIHPILGPWFVDPTRRLQCEYVVTDRVGASVADSTQFRSLVIERVYEYGQYAALVSSLRAGEDGCTIPCAHGFSRNLFVAFHALCTALGVCLGTIGILIWLIPPRAELRREYLAAGTCPRCEYSIRGLTNPTCPECGESLV